MIEYFRNMLIIINFGVNPVSSGRPWWLLCPLLRWLHFCSMVTILQCILGRIFLHYW